MRSEFFGDLFRRTFVKLTDTVQVEYILTQNSAGRVQALKVVGENGGSRVFWLWGLRNPPDILENCRQAPNFSASRIPCRRTEFVMPLANSHRPSTAEGAIRRLRLLPSVAEEERGLANLAWCQFRLPS